MKTIANHTTRVKHFGQFEWTWTGSLANPEAVSIAKDWRYTYIVKAVLPGMDRHVWIHRDAVEPFSLWLERLEREKVRDNLAVCAGAWVPRFVRQSGNLHERMAKCRALAEARATHRLSNHSWGTAIDFDAARYPLGRACPPGDPRWTVAELAAEYGIAWGGHYTLRKDPMHFELVRP